MPTSSSKSKRAKKNLDFNQATEGQASASDKNFLNLPYTDLEEEVELIEEEMPKKESLEEITPGVQSSKHEYLDFQTPEEGPFPPEAQDLEAPEA